MRVLLVEDDVRVAAALATALRRRSFAVTCTGSADEALAAPAADLVLLDRGLPDRDGLTVCRELRRRHPEVSIIVVSGRGEEHDRIAGLRAGADDYLVKPFSMVELQARMDAVMRRAVRGARPAETIELGDLRIEVAIRSVTLAGDEVTLTPREFDILLALARRPGLPVSRHDVQLSVWHASEGAGRSLEVHVASLRTKLRDRERVGTVRGVGYRLRAH